MSKFAFNLKQLSRLSKPKGKRCQPRRNQSFTSKRQPADHSSISPLLQLELAVLRYPSQHILDSIQQQQDDVDSADLELGLEADTVANHLHKDLFLEIEQTFKSNSNEQLHHLQTHWKEQFTSYEYSNHPPLHLQDLQIYPNTECKSSGGGHILLGRNASGKSLILKSLIHNIHSTQFKQVNPYLQSGNLHIDTNFTSQTSARTRYNPFLSHVTFETHSQLLRSPISVHRALIPGGGNRLSPTAQFLIVRLGMYPLLPRRIDTLSTGQMRRVLLVRALVLKPSLLLLDNVMDGLDAMGRDGVQNILERVLEGFRMDILVQGVNAKDTARTQVLLSTLREEEISGGFGVITFLNNGEARTERRDGRSGIDLVRCLGHWNEDSPDYDEFVADLTFEAQQASEDKSEVNVFGSARHELPTSNEVNNFWEYEKTLDHNTVLVEANQLKIARDDTILLSDLNWTVQRSERWHLAGTNGGKSNQKQFI
jgi:ABC-type molybdenum transport system ATPase subunit/photorepair protein PhrA